MRKQKSKVSTVLLALVLIAGTSLFSGRVQAASLSEVIQGRLLPPQQEVHNHLHNCAEKLDRLLDASLKGNIPQDQYHALLRAAIGDVESARAANKLGLDRCNRLLNEDLNSVTPGLSAAQREQIWKRIEQMLLAPQQETHNHLYNLADKLGRLLDAALKGNIPRDQYLALLRASIEDVKSARAVNRRGLENSEALLAEKITKDDSPALDAPSRQALESLRPQLQTTANLLAQTRGKTGQILAATQGGTVQHGTLADLIRSAVADLDRARAANDQGLRQTNSLLTGERVGISGNRGGTRLESGLAGVVQERVHAPQQVSANHLNNLREKLESLLHGTLKKNMNAGQLNALARAAAADLDSAVSAHDSARQILENLIGG